MSESLVDALARRVSARLSRRAALASGAALAGFGEMGVRSRAVAQEATPVASPTAGSGSSSLAHTDAELLFVQVSPDATWAQKQGADGVYLLTLTHRDGQTVYFSDRPERLVGVVTTQVFLAALGFTPGDPPNAAIVAGEEILVVELTNPLYDRDAGVLTYEAALLDPSAASSGIQHLARRQTDQDLPTDLGPTSLFIDSAQAFCDQFYDCYYDSESDTGDNCELVEDPGTDGYFQCEPGGIPGGPIDACYDYGTFDCQPCDGSGKDSLDAACNSQYAACNSHGGCSVYVGK